MQVEIWNLWNVEETKGKYQNNITKMLTECGQGKALHGQFLRRLEGKE